MLMEEQIKLAKGAVLGLLTQAYQKRYRVGVVVFSHEHAHVALQPTTSINRARNALQAVASGGGTPLAHGFHTALKLIRGERVRHPIDQPQLILITDGDPTFPLKSGADIKQECLELASQFPEKQIPVIVLATAEPGSFLEKIAVRLKAPLYKLSDVVIKQ